ncbi:MAG: RecX family transcriptional regulator [Clostridiales bacterium]|nr:RecX family transcriptional regulator [Clostridiales bacterium]
MGKITDISRQKRVKTRFSVYIDGEFVCGLDEVTVAASRISIGDEIDAEKLKELVFTSEVNCAFERAVSYLSAAPRSRKEIYMYLVGKGYDKPIALEVLGKLDSYKYIDDRAYAELYIKSKSAKYGAFRIAAELRQKGVDGKIIDELLEDAEEDAEAVARKYLKSHRGADVQKLKRFLASRGYSWDAISSAVSALADELSSEEYYD